MTAASQVLQRMEGHSATATRGLRFVRTGMEELALQAAGLSGGLGKVSAGLLTLGGGAPEAVAALARVAAVGGALAAASAALVPWEQKLATDRLKAAEAALKAAMKPQDLADLSTAGLQGIADFFAKATAPARALQEQLDAMQLSTWKWAESLEG